MPCFAGTGVDHGHRGRGLAAEDRDEQDDKEYRSADRHKVDHNTTWCRKCAVLDTLYLMESPSPVVAGTLYVVGTPIGDHEDLSPRARAVLGAADIVLCEDTRRTRRLLSAVHVSARVMSYHGHNETERVPQVLGLLRDGQAIALVSDAGTPALSDPGAAIVREAREAEFPVVPVPGPSAVTALISVAGVGMSGWAFAGFFSPKRGKRTKRLETFLATGLPFVVFEGPHRIVQLLQDLASIAPTCRVIAGREMTKAHEQYLDGSPDAVVRSLEACGGVRGEFTLLVVPSAPDSV